MSGSDSGRNGLPFNVKLDGLEWDETLGYLDTICSEGMPVLVGVTDSRQPRRPVVHARGRLRIGDSGEKDAGPWYWMEWPPGSRNGIVELPKDQFESGSLETLGYDVYFTLSLSFGGWSITVSDCNDVSWPGNSGEA